MASVEGFLVGAGTVLSADDVDAAIDAGAQYLVSPGLDEPCVHRAAERGIPFVPGVATATEVQRAQAAGLSHVKLFPAGALGGRSLIDALAGPFPQMRFLPSGGVDPHNLSTTSPRRPFSRSAGAGWCLARRSTHAICR